MSFQLGISTFGELTDDAVTGAPADPLQRMKDTIEQAVVAEQAGLDLFGVGEHHRSDFIASTPAIILTAIAVRTDSIRLTSAVTVLSSADPVRTFQDFATLDLVSSGRAEIIAGRGSFTESFPLFGLELDDYAELYREKLELLVAIRDQNPITWSGRFRTPLIHADIAPRPLQPTLPIWVGVGGTPSSGARAGRLGLPMIYGVLLGPIDSALRTRVAFEDAARRNGHDPNAIPTAFSGHGYVARTSQGARDLMYPHFAAGFAENARQRGQGMIIPRAAFDAQASPLGALTVGSPQEVIDKLMLQYELYGTHRVLLNLGLGGLPQKEHLTAIELLGTEVAPVVRREIAARESASA